MRIGFRTVGVLACAALAWGFGSYADAAIGIQVEPATWSLGSFGSQHVAYKDITVSNLSTANETISVNIKTANSANWTLVQAVPGANQFAILVKGGISGSTYTYVTSSYKPIGNYLNTTNKWSLPLTLNFLGPSSVSGGGTAEQTISVDFQGQTSNAGWSYNSAGDFYWRSMGMFDEPANADWSDTESSVMPTAYWQHMSGVSISSGWAAPGYGFSSNGSLMTYVFSHVSNWNAMNPSIVRSEDGYNAAFTSCPWHNIAYRRRSVAQAQYPPLSFAQMYSTSTSRSTLWVGSNLITSAVWVYSTRYPSFGSLTRGTQQTDAYRPSQTAHYCTVCYFAGSFTMSSNGSGGLTATYTLLSVSATTTRKYNTNMMPRVVILD